MSHWLPLCVVIFAMYVGAMMTHIPTLPRCPFCGKNREHAKNCPTQRGR